MTRRGHRHPEASPTAQLAAEIEWLVNEAGTEWRPRSDTAGAVRVNCRPLPALVRPGLATQIEEILHRPELLPLLRIIGQHNSRPREIPGRRLPQKDNFLLGPYLFQVLISVEGRNEQRRRLPALDQPAAQVRDHLQDVAANCKNLAALIRKGPQPHVALARKTGANDLLRIFAPLTELFEASDSSERQVVALGELMARAADWFEVQADQVPRAKQNRRPSVPAAWAERADLRTRAAELLPGIFRKQLGHWYRAHVATIATIVSKGIETDADFVRKVERQQTGAERRRDGERLTRKNAETFP
jgi:hypothetical protein